MKTIKPKLLYETDNFDYKVCPWEVINGTKKAIMRLQRRMKRPGKIYLYDDPFFHGYDTAGIIVSNQPLTTRQLKRWRANSRK